jgi:hypothetical protein
MKEMGPFNKTWSNSHKNGQDLSSNLSGMSEALELPIFIFNEYGIIGGICAALALLFSSHGIVMHLYFFNEPKLQLYIVRILLMVPVRKYNCLDIFSSILAFFDSP